ncbi:MAG: hypothetical protein E6K63_12425 [Nitrospirae bacterium]|nr:MAG: hypothetical protein E6K63_12425 [Nitrospirota bacterium]
MGAAVGLMALMLPAACKTMPQNATDTAVASAVLGYTKEQLIGCAGPPVEDVMSNDSDRPGVRVLRYARMASVLEESFPVARSSFPEVRHGCMATLSLAGDRVIDVHIVGL